MNIRLLSLPVPLIAFIAGALSILSFAPFGLWPLQIASLTLVFYFVLCDKGIKRSVLIGWAYGFGWTLCGVYWLFITMHRYGHIPAWLSALAVVLLASCVLAPFFAFALGVAAWLRQRWSLPTHVMALMVLPATWALSEWLRSWILTGLPWVVSGYAHTASPLAGFAPLLGVYGLGWISAVIAGSLALGPAKKWPFLIALSLLGCGFGLQSIAWTYPQGREISVRLLQGNVPQDSKFGDDHIASSLVLYEKMITAGHADLIATPETALPLFIHQLPDDYLSHLSAFARESNSRLAIGLFISDGPELYANSVIGIDPAHGSTTASPNTFYRYSKSHLVPFGEYMPWGFRWFVEAMKIPLADQTPGPAVQAPFAVKDQWILPNICFEDLFGEKIAAQILAAHVAGKPQATMLLNLSNLGWFDDSTALPQHLQISQMRALETGRPMLRATNTGATAVINPKGVVLAQLPVLTRDTLTASVQGFAGITPYILCGNIPIVALCFLMLALACLFGCQPQHSSKTR